VILSLKTGSTFSLSSALVNRGLCKEALAEKTSLTPRNADVWDWGSPKAVPVHDEAWAGITFFRVVM